MTPEAFWELAVPFMKEAGYMTGDEDGEKLEWLKKVDKSRLRHIYVMHLSNRNANAQQVKRDVMKITGVPTTIFDE